jgi:acetyltransferase-like isoleucine patch superfamily enzyme
MGIFRTLARSLYWIIINKWGRSSRLSNIELTVQWRGKFRAEIGLGCYIGARTTIAGANGSRISIGEKSWIGADCEISATSLVRIGSHVSLQHRTQVHGDVQIGAGFVGAAGVYISSGHHEFRRQPALPIRLQDRLNALEGASLSRPVVIGEDCWLGICVAVMPGVEIGRGCIVGANSVVTHSLPPYSIAGGSPARILGKRLDFKPPVVLNATNDDHLPYFYEGFLTIPDDACEVTPRRLRGGFEATEAFSLACDCIAGDLFKLHVDASIDLTLSHGSSRIQVRAGKSAILLSAAPNADGMLRFEQASTSQAHIKGRLSVLGVN